MSSPNTTPTSPGSTPAASDVRGILIRLRIYRVMAYIAGVSLLALTASMILRYGFGNDVLHWVAIPHGWLYLVYLITVLVLGTAVRWSIGRTVLVMLAGTIPFVSFVAERNVTHQVLRTHGGR